MNKKQLSTRIRNQRNEIYHLLKLLHSYNKDNFIERLLRIILLNAKELDLIYKQRNYHIRLIILLFITNFISIILLLCFM